MLILLVVGCLFLFAGKALETFGQHFIDQTEERDLVLESEVVWPMSERQYPYD